MLMPLYQQSEVFAASRLTSFGEGPILLSSIIPVMESPIGFGKAKM